MRNPMLAAALSMFMVSGFDQPRREARRPKDLPDPHPSDFNSPEQKAKRAAKKLASKKNKSSK